MICAKCGRNDASCNLSNNNKILYYPVLKYQAERKAKKSTQASFISRQQGKILHHKYMDWNGCSTTSNKKKYCCELHNFEWLEKIVGLRWKRNTFKQTYKMLVPKQIGNKLSFADTTTTSKGLARDCALARLLTTDVNSHIINHDETITVKDCDEMISDLQTQKSRTLKERLHISKEMNIVRAAQVERLKSDPAQNATIV
jgi:hypothetical protein